jgi:choline kinase
MKGVVLAGCASRLRPYSDDAPRALLSVGGVPILRRALTNLVRSGIDQLVIGTGYGEELVRAAVAEWFPELDVTFVTNAGFGPADDAAALAVLRPQLEGHAFFLLDGAVVFDLDVLATLLDHGSDCVAVRSVGPIGKDDVKVVADKADRVLTVGRDLPVRGAMGEAAGIGLFSADTSRRLFAALDRGGDPTRPWEAVLQEVIDGGAALRGVDLGSRYACEIETIDDLRAATARLAARPAFETDVRFRLAV